VITKVGQGSWVEKEEERQGRLNARTHTECAREEPLHVHRRLRSCVCGIV